METRYKRLLRMEEEKGGQHVEFTEEQILPGGLGLPEEFSPPLISFKRIWISGFIIMTMKGYIEVTETWAEDPLKQPSRIEAGKVIKGQATSIKAA